MTVQLRPRGMFVRFFPALLILVALLAPVSAQAGGSVLKDIEKRGVVRCGATFAPGFFANAPSGRPEGLMVDFCRALALAVLGKANAIEIHRFAATQELTAVEHGEVDVSFALSAWTLSAESTRNVEFGPAVLHDEQALAGWRSLPPGRSEASTQRSVCVVESSPAAQVLADFLTRTGRSWQVRQTKQWDDALQLFLGRGCDFITAPRLMLETTLIATKTASDIVFEAEPLARLMVAPVTTLADNGGRDWARVVRWSMFALMLADQKGVSAAHAGRPGDITDDEIRRLFNPSIAGQGWPALADWALRIVSELGNYGEIFERHLGKQSPFGLDRGANRPWSQGGMLYPPPFQ